MLADMLQHTSFLVIFILFKCDETLRSMYFIK